MITMVNILKCSSRNELRGWLSANCRTEKECWIICSRSNHIPEGVLSYLDVVEEALCFGWIDSTVKTVDGVNLQRISPRRKNSKWSELNKERCRRLERMGLMTDFGRAVLPDMELSSFQICNEILFALKEDAAAWENYQKFPPLYCRVRIDTIQIKRNSDLFKKRLDKFIENTRQNIMYGEWNDGGRLL